MLKKIFYSLIPSIQDYIYIYIYPTFSFSLNKRTTKKNWTIDSTSHKNLQSRNIFSKCFVCFFTILIFKNNSFLNVLLVFSKSLLKVIKYNGNFIIYYLYYFSPFLLSIKIPAFNLIIFVISFHYFYLYHFIVFSHVKFVFHIFHIIIKWKSYSLIHIDVSWQLLIMLRGLQWNRRKYLLLLITFDLDIEKSS